MDVATNHRQIVATVEVSYLSTVIGNPPSTALFKHDRHNCSALIREISNISDISGLIHRSSRMIAFTPANLLSVSGVACSCCAEDAAN
jgi:hypothetical protein